MRGGGTVPDPASSGRADQHGPSRRFALARLHRNGESTAVWVPDEEREAIRDLERAREDFKHTELRMRRRLNGFLLRHGRVYSGVRRWTQAHYRWLETQHIIHPAQQIVFQEYLDAVKHAGTRIKTLEEELARVHANWNFSGQAQDLMALCGVDTLTAITVLAELGDITCFDTPRQLMADVSLVPREHSSGARLPRRAMSMCGGSWWNRPDAIATRPARPGTCSAALNSLHPQCTRSPGKRREGCADVTGAFRLAACPKARSVRLYPEGCSGSCGPSHGNADIPAA